MLTNVIDLQILNTQLEAKVQAHSNQCLTLFNRFDYLLQLFKRMTQCSRRQKPLPSRGVTHFPTGPRDWPQSQGQGFQVQRLHTQLLNN